MSEELKPCPWCGGKAEMRGDDAPENWVHCKANCQPTGRHKPSLIKAWNTRPDNALIDALVEAVRKAIERLQKDAHGAECATQRRLNTVAILQEALAEAKKWKGEAIGSGV